MRQAILRGGLLILTALLLIAGCKKSPTGSVDPLPVSATGSFLGYTDFGGGSGNYWLRIQEPDSAAVDSTGTMELEGAIHYNGTSTVLLIAESYADGDSLRIEWVRDDIRFAGSTAVASSGFYFEFSDPSWKQPMRANREIGGYNLTGLWNGSMSSNALQVSRDAQMGMDQQSSLYLGWVEVNYLGLLHGDLVSGNYAGPDFTTGGTAQYGGESYELSLTGTFARVDTIAGSWTLRDEGVVDGGEFLFWRTFE
jgi:hypothetical protein